MSFVAHKSMFCVLAVLVSLAGELCISSSFGAVAIDDWPFWRGPNHNDVSRESDLLESWPVEGPKQLWVNQKCGLGYAGIAVVGDNLFTMGVEDEQEFALCLNAETGTEIWRANLGARFNNAWGDGPRSTPSVDGDFVYCMSANGNLACLKAKDGSQVWAKKMSDFGGAVPYWGYAESPLVSGDQVVCTPSGPDAPVMVALDKLTGKTIWQSEFKLGKDENKAYSSIVPAELDGKKQYVQLTLNNLIGISAAEGSLLWKSKWPGRIAVIPSPIVDGNRIYVTSGYGAGCKLVEIEDGGAVNELWSNKVMKNHHGGAILVDDHFYGYSDQAGWVCQDKTDGKMVWNDKKIDKGSITYADGLFYHLQEKDGEVILLKADPQGLEEKGRFKLSPQTERRKPQGMIWMHPVISDGKLYLRDQEIICCYDIRDPNAKRH